MFCHRDRAPVGRPILVAFWVDPLFKWRDKNHMIFSEISIELLMHSLLLVGCGGVSINAPDAAQPPDVGAPDAGQTPDASPDSATLRRCNPTAPFLPPIMLTT